MEQVIFKLNKANFIFTFRILLGILFITLITESCASKTPLIIQAVLSGSIENLKFELEKKHCQINATDKLGLTGLMWAINICNNEMAMLLLEAGADSRHLDKEGQTGLMYAVLSSNCKLNKGLISRICSDSGVVDIESHSGYTALGLAIMEGKVDAVRLLLENRANPKYRNRHGQTLMDIALEKPNAEVIAVLTQSF